MVDIDDVLDARQASHYLKIKEQTIRRLARNSEIPAFKVGGVWSSPAIGADGTLYVGGLDGNLYAFGPGDG